MSNHNLQDNKENCCDSCEQPVSSPAVAQVRKKISGWGFTPYIPAIISFVLLIAGIVARHFLPVAPDSWYLIFIFLAAYFIVGRNTIWKAIRLIPTADIFNEFFLMTLATAGAFLIGDYPEGVAVMLFYEVGELFNSAAVQKARRSVKALLDVRPDIVTVKDGERETTRNPREVRVGEIIVVRPGERVALDGALLSPDASFNTAALTGESVPVVMNKGDKVLAGMISLHHVALLKVTEKYENSALARIMEMTQHALARKAKAEKFIRRFAKVYTPSIVFLATALVVLPYFLTEEYVFRDWLYRALIFLVISCPCALVISIPLGYFGGIGASSAHGILFKGSDFLDRITMVDTVVLDKTGTVTKGVFKVHDVSVKDFDRMQFIKIAAALESRSNHPVARAVVEYNSQTLAGFEVTEVQEIPGQGIIGKVGMHEVLAGSAELLAGFNIALDDAVREITETVVAVAIDGKYWGYFVVSDELKEDAEEAVKRLHDAGVKNIVMLSGDKDKVVQRVAKALSIDAACGDLLPGDKVKKVEALQKEGRVVAFAGDGINDAPVIALADVGIAMGALGSDAAIETADVVIQTDQPSKISTAIRIGRATNKIVWQNIALAFGVKLLVLALGALGIATMWEAVFADVGVALLAILNAIRIQKMTF